MTPLEKALSWFDERLSDDSTDSSDDYIVVKSHSYSLGYVKEIEVLRPIVTDQICLYLAMEGIRFTRAKDNVTLYLTKKQVIG
ncbi:MAG: hypothetical protein KME47_10010 [Nodosilinea sp. WJT8-NPBG4]|jgi:hypothetical protein|nr:hypothetical protein [Nodosilinea sp. WJT8-NPBG4]